MGGLLGAIVAHGASFLGTGLLSSLIANFVVVAFGGMALGLALDKGWRTVVGLALCGGIGAVLTLPIRLLVIQGVPVDWDRTILTAATYILRGMLVSAALGLALWNLRYAVFLAFAGALGSVVVMVLPSTGGTLFWLQPIYGGFALGGLLGAVLGSLERE